MRKRTFMISSAGGEVSPGIAARPDLEKFRSCALSMLNFHTRRLGECCNRSGLLYAATLAADSPSRLIPFQYNTTTGYLVILHADTANPTEPAKLQVMTAAGAIVTFDGGSDYLETPWNANTIEQLRHSQSADFLFLAGGGVLPRILKRYSETNWTLESFDFSPALSAPTGQTATVINNSGGGSSFKVAYKVSVVDSDGNESEASAAATAAMSTPWGSTTSVDLAWTPFTDAALAADPDFLLASISKTFPNGVTTYLFNNPIDLPGYGKITMTANSAMPSVSMVISGTDKLGKAQNETIACSGLTSITSTKDFRSVNYMRIYNGGSSFTRTITAGHGTASIAKGSYSYRIYKNDTCASDYTGGWFGFVASTRNNSWTDRNVAPSLSSQPVTHKNPFDGVGKIPSLVSIFQQRLWFANFSYEPQRLISSRPGLLYNFSASDVVNDADPIDFSVDDAYSDRIEHLVPMRDLLVITAGSCWIVAGGDAGVTAISRKTTLQSRDGGGSPRPAVSGNSVIYASRDRRRVLAIGYKLDADGYVADDLTDLAEHLFRDQQIKQMSMANSPEPILWIVTDAGKLYSLTFRRMQSIVAFARHESPGAVFESVAVTSNESGTDTVWVSTKRTRPDTTTFRTVERLAPRTDSATTGIFLDCAKVYSGTATTTITGAGHLDGQTITALADGVVRTGLTVAGGQFTLPTAASHVVYGIPYVSEYQSVPMSAFGESPDAGIGRDNAIIDVALRLRDSRGGHCGSSFDRLSPIPYDSALAAATTGLKSGHYRIPGNGQWEYNATACVRQDQPLPMTIEALAITYQQAEG